ncbi:hypothetical protein [Dyadobacter aurulentus]|uniref:hypothetical protein n=1 Tax=Dyadobacter sp. UC 10 TaxID=2605428 RepID=UPI0011F0A7F5|nr:hypothetical protein [Dyadobacter sp. UC 10]KAA0989068.1 hypothetical protein FXO21_02250 [Dyadobacter sp. UC 10]
MKSTFWKVWGIPVIIGILSGIGLLSALTGDGFFDILSWLTLGIPVFITIWYLIKAKNKRDDRRIRSM